MTGSVVTTGTANMLQLDIAADTTLATPLVLPTGFATVTGASKVTAMLADDGSDICTTRTVPAAATAAFDSLHGFVADATLATPCPWVSFA